MLRTARTGRTTGIHSDARYRFERGVDPQSCVDGLNLAIALILEYGGGAATKGRIVGSIPARLNKVTFYHGDVERLTGLVVKPAEMKRILKDLEFDIEDAGDAWYLMPPSHRFDIDRSADIVEEIARLVGYDQLPTTSLPMPEGLKQSVAAARQSRVSIARRAMAARGFLEAVTWSFMAREHAALFGKVEDALTVANPVASELNYMRPTALGNLAQAAQRARAFGLAIMGDTDRAAAIVEQVMPRDMATRIVPYLAYMPRLTKPQQAAAVKAVRERMRARSAASIRPSAPVGLSAPSAQEQRWQGLFEASLR